MVHNEKVTGNEFYEWNVWYFTEPFPDPAEPMV